MNMESCFVVKARLEGEDKVIQGMRRIEGETKRLHGGTSATGILAAREQAFRRGLTGAQPPRAGGVRPVKADDILSKDTTREVQERAGKIGTAFRWAAVTSAAYGAYRITKKVAQETYNVGKAIMDNTETYKQLQITMEAIYGDEAKSKMAWLVEKAKYLPGTVQEFIRGAIQIKMMGGPFGIDIAEMKEGKTLLEDLVKLAAIRPERGFFGAMHGFRMAVFGDYWRTLRMQFGISKELIERQLGIPKESITGPMKTRERYEALRGMLGAMIGDEFIEKARKLAKSAGTAFKTQWWLMLSDIGKKSGMYDSIVKATYDVVGFMETFAKSSLWQKTIKFFGEPFKDISEAVSSAAKIAEAQVAQGKPGTEIALEAAQRVTGAVAKAAGKTAMQGTKIAGGEQFAENPFGWLLDTIMWPFEHAHKQVLAFGAGVREASDALEIFTTKAGEEYRVEGITPMTGTLEDFVLGKRPRGKGDFQGAIEPYHLLGGPWTEAAQKAAKMGGIALGGPWTEAAQEASSKGVILGTDWPEMNGAKEDVKEETKQGSKLIVTSIDKGNETLNGTLIQIRQVMEEVRDQGKAAKIAAPPNIVIKNLTTGEVEELTSVPPS